MSLQFDPAESRLVSRCDLIVFAQVCQIFADGKAIRPGAFLPDWKYRDAWALDNHSFLDLRETDPGPYYPDPIPGYRKESPEGSGRFSTDPAIMSDAPSVRRPNVLFDPVKHPKGFKVVTFKLETFATCKKGLDLGKWYEGVVWEWELTWQESQKGEPGQIRVVGMNVGSPSENFLAAFDKYVRVKTQH
jgi:hypothetical protein